MDLSILLQATVGKGTDVILTVDFNAVIGEDHDALILLIHKAGLRDTIATCHGFETEIATYTQRVRPAAYRLHLHILLPH